MASRRRLFGIRALALLVAPALASLALLAQPSGSDNLQLPEPLYPEVIGLYERGNAEEALALLEGTAGGTDGHGIEATALRAALLAAVQRHGESALLWEEITRRHPALGATARAEATEAYIRSGDLGRAQASLAQVASGGTRSSSELPLMLATSFRVAGQLQAAEALYRAVLRAERQSPAADSARNGLAVTLSASGRPEEAIVLLRETQLSFRDAAAYTEARRLEEQVAGGLGRDRAARAEPEYRTMAERLARAAEFRAANEVLEEWRRQYPSSPSADRIEASIIENLYQLRENDETMRRATALLRRVPAGPIANDLRVLLFRLDVREGRTSDVRARGRSLWRGDVPLSQAERESLGRLYAAYLVSVGELEEGLEVYRELYRAARNRADRIDLLWRASVAAFRAGQLPRARSNLEYLLGLKPGPEIEPLATYWLAETETRLGRRDRARELLSRLARSGRFEYYARLAAPRLAELHGEAAPPDPPAGSQFPLLSLSEAAHQDADYRAAMTFARAGLWRHAAGHLRALLTRRPDAAVALLAARAASRARDYRSAQRLLTSWFAPYLDGHAALAPADFLQLVYPRAFWTEVSEAATGQRVDPYLLLAIMKQESVFDPRARSPVGAIGLFQVMPYTAAEIGPALGHDRPDAVQLMQPATSAAFAAKLLRDLLSRYEDELLPTIAAYNAGADRVDVWWQTARAHGDASFVDSIPYSQTRRYVREVLNIYAAYRDIYGATRTEDRELRTKN